ncbi:YceI family protein [Rhizobium aegyptiacum]|uniref:YceI family protein n=1 Tax=Rhizobium aegyptiacum TaxID=1764550 RepID=UPI0009EF127F|nr:YceI family protein [Rhizobium aegyptiacum]
MIRKSQTAFGALLMLTGVSVNAALAADTYSFDKDHTEIRFAWDHLGLSLQSAEFRGVDGSVIWDRDNLANSKVTVTIPSTGIATGIDELDEALRGGDFFDVEKHPQITFVSNEVRKSGVDRGIVSGDLTIRGVTRPVNLDVMLKFDGEHPAASMMADLKGVHYAGFTARGRILRSDFGFTDSVPLVSDWIEIAIETEMRRQQ